MRNLGSYFESLSYEYTLPKAIKEGYLSPIKALTIPLKIDMTGVGVQAGDFKASDISTALDPYLQGIAQEMEKYCKDKKTVVFLPLVKTSQKFRDLLMVQKEKQELRVRLGLQVLLGQKVRRELRVHQVRMQIR